MAAGKMEMEKDSATKKEQQETIVCPSIEDALKHFELVKSLSLAEALALAQSEMVNPTKDKEVDTGKYKYKYATLDRLMDIIRPACNRWGIFFTQPVIIEPRGTDGAFFERLQTVVTKGDQSLILTMMTLPPYTDEKTRGAQLTYFRRHEAAAVFGLAGEEDTSEHHERKEYNEIPSPKTYTDTEKRQLYRDKDDAKRALEAERAEMLSALKTKIKIVEALGMSKDDVSAWVEREIGKDQKSMTNEEVGAIIDYLDDCAKGLSEQNIEQLQLDENVDY